MVLGMGSDVRGWDVWHTLFKCIYSLLWVWLVGLSGVGCTFANCIHCLFWVWLVGFDTVVECCVYVG